MCAVTNRAKSYQLALLIKKSLDDVMGTQQSACEATLQYQYQNINFSRIYALFLVTHLKKCVYHIIYKFKLTLCVSFRLLGYVVKWT